MVVVLVVEDALVVEAVVADVLDVELVVENVDVVVVDVVVDAEPEEGNGSQEENLLQPTPSRDDVRRQFLQDGQTIAVVFVAVSS